MLAVGRVGDLEHGTEGILAVGTHQTVTVIARAVAHPHAIGLAGVISGLAPLLCTQGSKAQEHQNAQCYAKNFHFTLFPFIVLNDALCHHGIGHLHESGNIGTLHVVNVAIGTSAILHTLFVDGVHDVV